MKINSFVLCALVILGRPALVFAKSQSVDQPILTICEANRQQAEAACAWGDILLLLGEESPGYKVCMMNAFEAYLACKYGP